MKGISSELRNYRRLRDRLDQISEQLAQIADKYGIITLCDTRVAHRVGLHSNFERVGDYNLERLSVVIHEDRKQLREPFKVAVLGEFSRGKSTFINALIGRELLVSDYRPNTAARTTLKHGLPSRVRVHYNDDRAPMETETKEIASAIGRYTSDTDAFDDTERLTSNRVSLANEIREVEVWDSLPFLGEREIELIDTPGLGSVFEAHQFVTYSVIPSADVILFVVQSDPGMGAEETHFLTSLVEHLPRFMFLMTKADAAESPQQLEDMLEFVRAVLREHVGIEEPTVFPVSSIKALKSHTKDSGFPDFVAALDEFLARSPGQKRIQQFVTLLHAYLIWIELAVHERIRGKTQESEAYGRRIAALAKDEREIHAAQRLMENMIASGIGAVHERALKAAADLPKTLRIGIEQAIQRMDAAALTSVESHLIEATVSTLNSWFETQKQAFLEQSSLIRTYMQVHIHSIFPGKRGIETSGNGSVNTSTAPVNTTFRVRIPAGSANAIYIAGDFGEQYALWDPGALPMMRVDSNLWEIQLSLPEGSTVEYKYTRGSWETVEKGQDGEEITNRCFITNGAQDSSLVVNDTVQQWSNPLTLTRQSVALRDSGALFPMELVTNSIRVLNLMARLNLSSDLVINDMRQRLRTALLHPYHDKTESVYEMITRSVRTQVATYLDQWRDETQAHLLNEMNARISLHYAAIKELMQQVEQERAAADQARAALMKQFDTLDSIRQEIRQIESEISQLSVQRDSA